jgi:hypothetical protein
MTESWTAESLKTGTIQPFRQETPTMILLQMILPSLFSTSMRHHPLAQASAAKERRIMSSDVDELPIRRASPFPSARHPQGDHESPLLVSRIPAVAHAMTGDSHVDSAPPAPLNSSTNIEFSWRSEKRPKHC